eukprot:3324686-Amphidinium_carterae.1
MDVWWRWHIGTQSGHKLATNFLRLSSAFGPTCCQRRAGCIKVSSSVVPSVLHNFKANKGV